MIGIARRGVCHRRRLLLLNDSHSKKGNSVGAQIREFNAENLLMGEYGAVFAIVLFDA